MTQKSQNKFAAGDVVVRTKPYEFGGDGGFMQIGGKYKVVDSYGKELVVEGSGIKYDPVMFELVKPTFKNMKFRVSSPEHSKEIQEALFEMGYKWGVNGVQGIKVMNTETPTIYTYDDGSIMYDSSDFESEYSMFNKSENQEFVVETIKSYKLIPVETPKETLTIDGKTYDKEAVLKRLAELEEVNNA